eukprot:Lankesteria_metandrocarpae@DN4311_c0_g1_i3.p1
MLLVYDYFLDLVERNLKNLALYVSPSKKTCTHSFKRSNHPRSSLLHDPTSASYGNEAGQQMILTAPILRTLSRTRTRLQVKGPFSKLLIPPFVVGIVESFSITPGKERTFVFGEARTDRGVAIVSTFDLNPFSLNFGDRLAKVLIHEIGHLFQLQHCVSDDCRMKPTRFAHELDAAPLNYCSSCTALVGTALVGTALVGTA